MGPFLILFCRKSCFFLQIWNSNLCPKRIDWRQLLKFKALRDDLELQEVRELDVNEQYVFFVAQKNPNGYSSEFRVHVSLA